MLNDRLFQFANIDLHDVKVLIVANLYDVNFYGVILFYDVE